MPRLLTLLTIIVSFLSACSTAMPTTRSGIPHHKPGVLSDAPNVVTCPSLLYSSTCTVSTPSGTPAYTWLFGDILAGDTIYRNGGVQFNNSGRITAVGCQTPSANDLVISCPYQIVSPGTINAHDHLSYNQNYPGGQNNNGGASNPNYVLCNDPKQAYSNPVCSKYRYDRRNEWREGLEGKPKVVAPWGGTEESKAWNELRHVIAGTTTIAGSGGQIGLARNPDQHNLMEGLVTPGDEEVDYDTFPLGDSKVVTGHNYGDCAYPNVAKPAVLDNLIFLPHVAEGINEYAHNELECLTGSGSGSVKLQAPNSTFIHAIAAIPSDSKLIKQSDMTLVWSPRSNISLYGNTAQVTLYDTLGIRMALSSDWTPSGSINLFREMTCAYDYNQNYLSGHFSKQELWRMITVNAARALGISDQVGTIAVGQWADLAVYNAIGKGYTSYYDPFIKGGVDDVSLVLRGGTPLYGDSDIVMSLDSKCETMPTTVCGNKKAVCIKETGYNLAQVTAANIDAYPLYYCETPYNEPSCVPTRYQEYSGTITSNDQDGDGIANNLDNCPSIFNPIRPMDNGKQADANHNGIGDACDPKPL